MLRQRFVQIGILSVSIFGGLSVRVDAAQLAAYTATVSDGCKVSYEYSANLATELDLVRSDQEAIGSFIHQAYARRYDVYAELSKASPRGSLTLPDEIVRDVNASLAVSRVLDPGIGFKVISARLKCTFAALDVMNVDREAIRRKIERGLSFLQEVDPVVQARGLQMLRDTLPVSELSQALSGEMRQRAADLAYHDVSSSLDVMIHDRPASGSVDFGLIALLGELQDSRAVDLYMTCVEKGFHGIRTKALDELGFMLPRPVRVVDRLTQLLEADAFKDPLTEEEVMQAILRIGRQESRSQFERLARGARESRAQGAMKMLEVLDRTVSQEPKPGAPNPPSRKPSTVVLPKPRI